MEGLAGPSCETFSLVLSMNYNVLLVLFWFILVLPMNYKVSGSRTLFSLVIIGYVMQKLVFP